MKFQTKHLVVQIFWAFVTLTAIVLGVVAASKADWVPLNPGDVSVFKLTGGADSCDLQQRLVTKNTLFRGIDTVEVQFTWCNTIEYMYFRRDSEGDIWVHGWEHLVDYGNGEIQERFVFDPPVVYIDLPLEIGKKWSTEFTMKIYWDGVFQGNYPVTQRWYYTVVDYKPISTPAGQFQAFKIDGIIDFWISSEVGKIKWYSPNTNSTIPNGVLIETNTAVEVGYNTLGMLKIAYR